MWFSLKIVYDNYLKIKISLCVCVTDKINKEMFCKNIVFFLELIVVKPKYKNR